MPERPVTKKHSLAGKNLPFKKFMEAFADISQIVDGTHEFKHYYHTCPVSVVEIDTFSGFKQYLLSNIRTLEAGHDDIEQHLRSLLYSVECIEQDCTYLRNMIDIKQRELNKDYQETKYSYASKRITAKRENAWNFERDTNMMKNL